VSGEQDEEGWGSGPEETVLGGISPNTRQKRRIKENSLRKKEEKKPKKKATGAWKDSATHTVIGNKEDRQIEGGKTRVSNRNVGGKNKKKQPVRKSHVGKERFSRKAAIHTCTRREIQKAGGGYSKAEKRGGELIERKGKRTAVQGKKIQI